MNTPLALKRAFFAICPPAPVRRELALAAARWLDGSPLRGRRTVPGCYHLTLRYLGDLLPGDVARLRACLDELRAAHQAAFDLELDQYGCFGRQVAWIGCRTPCSSLLSLRQMLEDRIRKSGLPAGEGTAFVPHVTLARGANGSWPKPPRNGPGSVHWTVREFRLLCSQPSGGPAYQTLARIPLEGGI